MCREVSFASLKNPGWSLLDVSAALTTKETYPRSLRLPGRLQDLWKGPHGHVPKARNISQLIFALPSLLVRHTWEGGGQGGGGRVGGGDRGRRGSTGCA